MVDAENQARRCARADERGFTLAEILVTVIVMSIAFVGLLSAMTGLVRNGAADRDSAVAEAEMRRFAEAVRSAPYVPCPGATVSSYVPAATAGQFDAGRQVVSIQAWQGTFSVFGTANFGACSGVGTNPQTDQGLQRITLRLNDSEGERLVPDMIVVKRRDN